MSLKQLVCSPTTPPNVAIDAIEEFILHRRLKGDSLFQVSLALAELEAETPPVTAFVFSRARYATNIPEPHDLIPIQHSVSASDVRSHLRSPSSMSQSRQVVLEYLLGKEQKMRMSKPGKGGRGTLGPEGFDEMSRRLDEIDEGIQAKSALLLSLRLSLAYLTFEELARQLLILPLDDAERTLVQYIRRHMPGEGRYAVGKELERLENRTTVDRPALRPVFRAAKDRTLLPQHADHPIPLPAPNKGSVVKLLANSRQDETQMAFALELVSEYLTREKRDYMLKMKWAKSGREQLSRDLVTLGCRRAFCLPPPLLPEDIVDPYLALIPPPPDPDDVPFRPPTIQSTTAALYVNPRLDGAAATRVLEEFVESEREEHPPQIVWTFVESVARRFPDGSYAEIFERFRRDLCPLEQHSPQSAESTPIRPPPIETTRLSPPSAEEPTTSSPAAGWWDVISALEPKSSAPWQPQSESSSELHSATEFPLPPGAEPARVVDYADIDRFATNLAVPTDRTSPPTLLTPRSGKVALPETPVPVKNRLFSRSPTLKSPKERKSVANEPGKWSREMVADIMGGRAS